MVSVGDLHFFGTIELGGVFEIRGWVISNIPYESMGSWNYIYPAW